MVETPNHGPVYILCSAQQCVSTTFSKKLY